MGSFRIRGFDAQGLRYYSCRRICCKAMSTGMSSEKIKSVLFLETTQPQPQAQDATIDFLCIVCPHCTVLATPFLWEVLHSCHLASSPKKGLPPLASNFVHTSHSHAQKVALIFPSSKWQWTPHVGFFRLPSLPISQGAHGLHSCHKLTKSRNEISSLITKIAASYQDQGELTVQ